MIKTHQYPKQYQHSALYSVTIRNGDNEVFRPLVLSNIVSDFTHVEFEEESDITVFIDVHTIEDLDPDSVRIRPVRYGIKCEVQGRRIAFKMKNPRNIKVDVDGLHDLFLYCCPIDNDIPQADDPKVLWIPKGSIYNAEKLELRDDMTVYIEGGAVLYGAIHGMGKNIHIRGRGIIDGGYVPGKPHTYPHTIQMESCSDSSIKDITIINPPSWTVVLGACQDFLCSNIKTLGYNISTDGIDICGSKDIVIENCFIKCNDDCIVIKAFKNAKGTVNWAKDVENIRVSNCVFQTVNNGAIMEIGHELTTDRVQGVIFEDCDVLGAHGFGSVFSIQNADRAAVSDVLYQNIYVEHCYDKLINFRVMDSMFAKGNERGSIRNITLRNIHWHSNIYNNGYTVSHIGGYDHGHTAEDIKITDFYINDEKVKDIDRLNIFTRHCSNIELI